MDSWTSYGSIDIYSEAPTVLCSERPDADHAYGRAMESPLAQGRAIRGEVRPKGFGAVG